MSTEELAAKVAGYFEATSGLGAKVAGLRDSVGLAMRRTAEASHSVKRSSKLSEEQRMTAVSILQPVVDELGNAQNVLAELAGLMGTVPEIRSTYQLLSDQMTRFTQRLGDAYETMSLGLTAEALVHEISVIADGLAERVADLKKHLDNPARIESKMKAFVRHVDTSIAALRKQLGHLDPSLKYARERREPIDMLEFCESLKSYHESRWREGDIRMEITAKPGKDLVVNINRGKLTQIFDNLILNSQYWLRESIRRGKKPPGTINIELNAPIVRFSDTGRGIDPSVAGRMFEPFVTTREGGRGLGLFIIRELLESEGGAIRLTRSRNSAGRQFEFELDLSGMVNDGSEK
jgi:C4-dicarboxylate-specific signal transduction histidine kinase